MAYQGMMRVTEQGKVVFATLMHKIILLYEMKNDGLVEQTSIIDWFGEYMPDSRLGEGLYSVIYNGRLPMAYRDISVTEDYIYALYSGRSFKEYGMKQLECLYICI